MTRRTLLIATRSADKLREIRQLLADLPQLAIIDLIEAGIPEDDAEATLERFDTFEDNARAKAHHFARCSGRWTLADDSGLCVDALDGAPGVRSKRFSGRHDLRGRALHQANNDLLLQMLDGVAVHRRTAHYFCALALAHPDGRALLFHGRSDGLILTSPRGSGGFGYDPLFFVPAANATFGELSAEEKNRLSHRARAVHEAKQLLPAALDPDPGHS